MRIAIVHDYLNQLGGAERVLEVAHDALGRPPVFTSVFDPARMPGAYREWDIRTSFLQRFPLAARRLGFYLPLLPTAFEQFDFSDFDVVLSISSAWAKGIVTGPATCHISMVLTPMRFAWFYGRSVRSSVSRAFVPLLVPLLTWLRVWDQVSANRVDRFVAISREVRARIQKFYGRASTILYPPVDTSRFVPGSSVGDHYLLVSRLRDYKRIDLAILAMNEAGRRLRIVGEGEDRRRLERMAGPSIEFLGRLGEEELLREYQSCRALVLPGLEDFGLTSVEAQACGRPVLAFSGGGVLDTVVEGDDRGGETAPTGVLFREATVLSLREGLERLERLPFDPDAIRKNALRFDTNRFRRMLLELVEGSWQAHVAEKQGG